MGGGSGSSAAASADDPWAAPRSSAPAAPPEYHPCTSLDHDFEPERGAGEVRESSRDFPQRTLEETRPDADFQDPKGVDGAGAAG
eukprot:7878730-Pyramimonas_sp.AAC.1